MPTPDPAARRRQAGVSLVELVMFIVIVSVGLVGILAALSVTAFRSADPAVRKQLLAVAESLLEEIELMPFTWCDPDDANVATATAPAGCAGAPQGLAPTAGESRTSTVTPFDNVGDYGGFSMSPVTDVTGALALAGYTATVALASPAGGLSGIPAADAIQIRVTVTGPGNESVSLEGYRARYAPNATQ